MKTTSIKNLFKYKPSNSYDFTLKPSHNFQVNSRKLKEEKEKKIDSNLDLNLKYLKNKYNTLINSDIIIREFSLTSRNKEYKAFLIYIDGMVDSNLINRFVLNPLMLRNSNNTFDGTIKQELTSQTLKDTISIEKVKKIDLENYIYLSLMPQNSLSKKNKFTDIINSINSGNCALFVDTVDVSFDIDVKGFKQRSVDTPQNEVVIKGPQEAFVENIRTNTSLLRRIANSSDLIIESFEVGKISNTKIAVCYMQNIANSNLVEEVKYRITNLELDNLFSTGQLEQLLEDNEKVGIPNLLSTERPDKCAKFLMQGRVIVIVNGNPYALIAPAVLIDFLSSPEDTNLKVTFANFLRVLRLIAYAITLLAPGIFIAITSFHQEILPTELLFSILASRESVPFPIIFELLLMELSFELIRESGLRVPSPIGATIGIVGALILGDAAVTAHIVSPILIIVVAITGLSSYAIPDFTFSFHLRIYRFLFVFLGYTSGLLGIGLGVYGYLNLLCSMKSFGVNYTSPVVPELGMGPTGYFVKPAWKYEKRASYVLPEKIISAPKISKKWKI